MRKIARGGEVNRIIWCYTDCVLMMSIPCIYIYIHPDGRYRGPGLIGPNSPGSPGVPGDTERGFRLTGDINHTLYLLVILKVLKYKYYVFITSKLR